MPATLEATRESVMNSNREKEILSAVDHLIKTHDDWESDPNAPAMITQAIEEAILAACEICEQGDIPAKCRQLCTVAVPRLRFEWDDYADGNRRTDGTPTARFWAAFKDVIEARKGAVPFVEKRPEPVAELLAQKVSYEQIARHIYGHNGKGPFLRNDGSIDIAAIKAEGAKPGSVIEDSWMHPLEVERKRKWEAEVDGRLTALTAREENEPRKHVDPRTIEDFLREGARPDVIARVKMVEIGEVLAVKNRLDDEEASQKRQMEQQTEAAPQNASHESKPPEAGGSSHEFDVDGFVQQQLTANLGIPEITEALKQQGVKMTQKAVREIAERLVENAT